MPAPKRTPAKPTAAKRKPAARRSSPAIAAVDRLERSIDLDAARAARAESAGQDVTVKFGGVVFTLPTEMPADFALSAADGRMRAAIDALFGDQTEAFFALRPSMRDLEALTEHVSAVYGISPGE